MNIIKINSQKWPTKPPESFTESGDNPFTRNISEPTTTERFRLTSAKPSTSYNEESAQVSSADKGIPSSPSCMKKHLIFSDIFPEGCGKPIIPNHLIRRGVETERGEWPWLAALYTFNDLGGIDFRCGGTLINNKHIVTAVALANPNFDEINLDQGAQRNFRKSEDLVVYSGLDLGQDTARGS
uniref:Peptidase S1 domain-containing protein n=1 Tax=Timema genevievae TaxID=629358 RepID=A0A7R9K751_TIMGE|nr:unnamed protein product [Timema genevievae]